MRSEDSHWQIPGIVPLIIFCLILGLIFRVSYLDRKVFWVDEVATVLRAAGYTKQEVTAALATGALHTPEDLLRYQQLTPERSLPDAIAAFQTSPEHAPLYFLLIRGWMQIWGSSVIAIRSFSVLCSLLVLPGIYWLSRLLFDHKGAAWLPVGLMAISPIFIAYAQEARPYSLWVLLLVLSGATLLRAMRHNAIGNWALYGLMLSLSFYTSLLSLLVAAGQGLYVAATEKFRFSQRTRRFSMILAAALIALLPWIWLAAQSWQTIRSNTTWMRLPLSSFAKATIWFYSAAILYFDVPVITEPWLTAAVEITVASGVVAVLLYAFYNLRQQSRQQWLFVLSLSLPVPFTLIVIDAISNGRYSTAPRYWLPFHLGAQLAVAYLISNRLSHQHQGWKWQSITVFLVGLCVLSNSIQFNNSPRYLKSRSLHNLPIAEIINRTDQPLVLSEAENTIDLLSLSHVLNNNVQLRILPTPQLIQQLANNFTEASLLTTEPLHGSEVFLFNPSADLQQQVSRTCAQFQPAYSPSLLMGELALSLWQLKLSHSC